MKRIVLLPNRNVIAARIISACREMEIPIIVAHSEEDAGAPYLKYATDAICIGKEGRQSPYMDINAIVEAGKKTGANLIHLGTGFLSENPHAVKIFAENGLKHIGASPEQMELASDKARVIQLAIENDIPVKPGSHRILTNLDDAIKEAEKLKFQVMIKPNKGGGGKGIKKIGSERELCDSYETAKKTAEKYFNDSSLYLEIFFNKIFHLELQLVSGCNEKGEKSIIVIGERNCTIQRNNQKIIEETPPLILTKEQLCQIEEWAKTIVEKSGYVGVCTVEFVINQADGAIYFSEINVRIQVEHGVTEILYRLDLIKAQICIATGMPTTIFNQKFTPYGHAIECRINAEKPSENFKFFEPSMGVITKYSVPGGNGIRVDSGVGVGSKLTEFYDTLIANVIVWGETREESIWRMISALERFEIEGIKTNIPFHLKILNSIDFWQGNYDSDLVQKILNQELSQELYDKIKKNSNHDLHI